MKFIFSTTSFREILNGANLQHLFLSKGSLAANLLGIHQTLGALEGSCCHLICPGYKELCAQKGGLEQ
jgi:hypothetical protein